MMYNNYQDFGDIDENDEFQNLEKQINKESEQQILQEIQNLGINSTDHQNFIQQQIQNNQNKNPQNLKQKQQNQKTTSYGNYQFDDDDFDTNDQQIIQQQMEIDNENISPNINHQQNKNRNYKKSKSAVQNECDDLKIVKQKLRTLFTFYATFGDRINITLLKSNNFHKMMLDAKLRDNIVLTQNRLDLMFIKENKHKLNMNFEVFLELIMKIAALKFNQYHESQSLQLLLENHLLPLYENIMSQTDLGEDIKKFQQPIDFATIQLIKDVRPIFLKIYNAYFPWETKVKLEKQSILQQSEKALFQFLKEYEICPTLVTKSTAFLLFNEIMDTPNEELCKNQISQIQFPEEDQQTGFQFTFAKFCAYIVKMSFICYQTLYDQLVEQEEENEETIQQLEQNKKSDVEKLEYLLERMELSSGFLNLQKKTHTPNSQSTSTIVHGKKTNRRNSQLEVNQQQFQQQQENQQKQQYQEENLKNNQVEYIQEIQSQRSNNNSIIMPQPNTSRPQTQRGSMINQLMNNNNKQNQSNILSQQQILVKNTQCFKNFEELKKIHPLNLQIFDKYSEQLHQKFQYYCSFGDPLNNSKMKSSKFCKLLKDSLVIGKNRIHKKITNCPDQQKQQLYQEDIDIIFAKINSQQHRSLKNILEFEQFLRCLELISDKLGQQNVEYLITNYLLNQPQQKINNFSNQNSCNTTINQEKFQQQEEQNLQGQNIYIQKLMGILQDQDIIDLLGIVHKSVLPFYNYYACGTQKISYQNQNNTINFDKFMKFSKDFGIFPEIVPKARLFKIFSTLSNIYSQTDFQDTDNINSSQMSSIQKLNKKQDKSVIDQHLFVEAIALCAFEVSFAENTDKPSNVEKICYLLERMNQSEGSKIIQRAQGLNRVGNRQNMLALVKKKYPHLFQCQQEQQYQYQGFDNNFNGQFMQKENNYNNYQDQQNDNEMYLQQEYNLDQNQNQIQQQDQEQEQNQDFQQQQLQQNQNYEQLDTFQQQNDDNEYEQQQNNNQDKDDQVYQKMMEKRNQTYEGQSMVYQPPNVFQQNNIQQQQQNQQQQYYEYEQDQNEYQEQDYDQEQNQQQQDYQQEIEQNQQIIDQQQQNLMEYQQQTQNNQNLQYNFDDNYQDTNTNDNLQYSPDFQQQEEEGNEDYDDEIQQ